LNKALKRRTLPKPLAKAISVNFERSFAEQTLGQQQPLRLRQFDRRYAELRLGDAAQVPIADAQGRGEFADPRARDCMFFDAGNRGADQAARRHRRLRGRARVRGGSAGRVEARALGRRRARIEAHVFALRRPRTGRSDGNRFRWT
jgi:hypothetical protein